MTQLHNDISNIFNVPNIIKNKDNKSYVFFDSKYLVLYSFLEGMQIGKLILDSELVKKIALELRRMHDFIKVNNYNLKLNFSTQ